MAGVEAFHQVAARAEAWQHRERQFVVQVPRQQGGMVLELRHARRDVRHLVRLRVDTLRCPVRAGEHVLHAVDHLDAVRMAEVHQVLGRGRGVRHEAVERPLRVDFELVRGDAAPVHAEREERLAVHDRAAKRVEPHGARRHLLHARKLAGGGAEFLAALHEGEGHVLRTQRKLGDVERDNAHVLRDRHRRLVPRAVRARVAQHAARLRKRVFVGVEAERRLERDGAGRGEVAVGAGVEPRDGRTHVRRHADVVEPRPARHALAHIGTHAEVPCPLGNGLRDAVHARPVPGALHARGVGAAHPLAVGPAPFNADRGAAFVALEVLRAYPHLVTVGLAGLELNALAGEIVELRVVVLERERARAAAPRAVHVDVLAAHRVPTHGLTILHVLEPAVAHKLHAGFGRDHGRGERDRH